MSSPHTQTPHTPPPMGKYTKKSSSKQKTAKKKANKSKGPKESHKQNDPILSMLNGEGVSAEDSTLMQQFYSGGSASAEGGDVDDALAAMMEQGTMCSAMAWVPEGAFALNPTRVSQIMREAAKMEGGDGSGEDDQYEDLEEVADGGGGMAEEEEEDDEFNMKDYDDEGESSFDEMMRVWTQAPGNSSGAGGGELRITSQASSGSNNKRKKKKKSGTKTSGDGDDRDEVDSLPSSEGERENYELKSSDRLLVTLCNEEFITTLQVWVYEEWCDNIFLHHDVVMRNHGLCVEWLNHAPTASDNRNLGASGGEGGFNLCAVGGFDSDIEIWDLDLYDADHPVGRIGTAPELMKKKKGKKGKTSKRSAVEGYHEGSVLGLSWNRIHTQFLASCGEDGSVRVWDLNRSDMPATASLWHNHSQRDSVQRVAWNQAGAGNGTMLLSGGFDGRCVLADPRNAGSAMAMDLCGQRVTASGGLNPEDKVPKSSAVESLQWKDEFYFSSSTDSGHVMVWDMRAAQSGPLMCFRAHAQECTNAVFVDNMPGMLVTSGGGMKGDGVVRYWDVDNGGNNPASVTLIHEQKSPGAGAVFSLATSSHLLAHAGLGGDVSTVRLNRCSNLRKHERWSQYVIGSEMDGREEEMEQAAAVAADDAMDMS